VGAIESVACAIIALSLDRAATWIRFGVSLLGTTRSFRGVCLGASALLAYDSYLVDSASSHMLVSKIKPCMSKYKQLYRETANGSLNQLSFI
jgi:hypothetical protein